MDIKRAKTFEALEVFIRTQRALLERTQGDITRLQKLRSDAIAHPVAFISDLNRQLDANSFRLSDQVDCRPALPQNIEWALYEGQDPTSLQTLARTTQKTSVQHLYPSKHQCSPLSDLQKFVKEARRSIVDPVLSRLATLVESDEDDLESESDNIVSRPRISTEELKREREREKLRELKKRKISGYGGLGLPPATYTYHQHGRARGPSGVFIRNDVEDESGEVDVDLSLDLDRDGSLGQDLSLSSTPMELDVPPPISRPSTLSRTASPPLRQPPRIRRPSTKLQTTQASMNGASSASTMKPTTAGLPLPRTGKAKRKRDISTELETNPIPIPVPATGKRANPDKDRTSGKPKSETYKQAWSVSEQHLLEQLLEQIPDGAKNRWQKISRAMDGKRTPRQVASRVQKYFEKLKRFGIDYEQEVP